MVRNRGDGRPTPQPAQSQTDKTRPQRSPLRKRQKIQRSATGRSDGPNRPCASLPQLRNSFRQELHSERNIKRCSLPATKTPRRASTVQVLPAPRGIRPAILVLIQCYIVVSFFWSVVRCQVAAPRSSCGMQTRIHRHRRRPAGPVARGIMGDEAHHWPLRVEGAADRAARTFLHRWAKRAGRIGRPTYEPRSRKLRGVGVPLSTG